MVVFLAMISRLIQRNSDNTISVRVYRKPTHTDQYLKSTSYHLARAKKSVITSLFARAKRSVITSLFDRDIISNLCNQEQEENHLTAVLQANGYPKKFFNNTVRARQSANSNNTENQEQVAQVRVNLPYVKDTSEQLKRIFNDHNINCIFYTTTTLHTLLSHAKDPDCPQSKETTLSINMTAKTVRLSTLENQNEQLHRELKNTPEL